VLYVGIVLFYFVILKLYARMRKLEQQITDLIRKQALDEVEKLEKK
jgi:small membrane protein